MRVLALSTLREFWEHHADTEGALRAWYRSASQANWQAPEDVKSTYRSASIIAGNRVVFNIKGNQYRLITVIHYNTGFIYIRFIGSHQEYDEVDPATI